MKEQIILVGGGGHCRSVIDVIEEENVYEIVGIVDIPEKVGSFVSNYRIFATDVDFPHLARRYKNFCITIGHVKSNKARRVAFETLKKLGVNFPVVKSPNAYVSKSVVLGEGTVIMHRSIINSNAMIGVCCIVNTGCVIEHDAVVEDHCHIAPSSAVSGGCLIKQECLIGSHAVIIPGIKITAHSLIAAGSVVTRDIVQKGMYAGNPATLKKKYDD